MASCLKLPPDDACAKSGEICAQGKWLARKLLESTKGTPTRASTELYCITFTPQICHQCQQTSNCNLC